MGATSSPDPTIAPFESGMPRLVPQSAILSRDTLARCGPSLTLPMGTTSSPGPPIAPFESGMPRLVLLSAILSRGTLTGCTLLLTLPMGATSSPDPPITPFESGMPMLVLQPVTLSRGIPTWSSLLLTLRMGSTSFLGLVTTLPVCGAHFHLLPSDLPLVAPSILNFMQNPTWRVGSVTRRVVYYTGYPTTV